MGFEPGHSLRNAVGPQALYKAGSRTSSRILQLVYDIAGNSRGSGAPRRATGTAQPVLAEYLGAWFAILLVCTPGLEAQLSAMVPVWTVGLGRETRRRAGPGHAALGADIGPVVSRNRILSGPVVSIALWWT